MAINREKRDTLARLLAEFMRCETSFADTNEAMENFDADAEEGRKGDRAVYDAWDSWRLFAAYCPPISEPIWSEFARHIAFLKSDLEARQLESPFPDDLSCDPKAVRLVRWHALALALALGVSLLSNLWVFAVATTISFILFTAASKPVAQERPDADEQLKWLREALSFQPFANRAEWHEHRHHFDECGVPAFGSEGYRDPLPPRPPVIRPGRVTRFAGWVVVGVVFGTAYLGSILIWPLWITLAAVFGLSSHEKRTVEG